MAKIGILTLFDENYNYGGILQACALCKVLNDMGHECKVLSYSDSFNPVYPNMMKRIRQYGIGAIIKKAAEKVSAKVGSDEFSRIFSQRRVKIEEFKDKYIPSTNHYDDSRLFAEYTDFDIIICGSDQVWNPNCIRRGFLQMFPNKGIKKVSYAASISRNSLSDHEKSVMIPAIKAFDHIAVRERTAQRILQQEGVENVWLTLDPTLLLDKNGWAAMASDRLIDQDYALCYFFSDSRKYRDSIQKLCDEIGIKLIFIPYAKQEFNRYDSSGAGEPLLDVGPSEFLSLFKNARYVFTDSFHGAAFSLIFNRQFFVFKRDKESKVSMNSRLFDLLNKFSISSRLVTQVNSVSELDKNNIDYLKVNEIIKSSRQESIDYLELATKL